MRAITIFAAALAVFSISLVAFGAPVKVKKTGAFYELVVSAGGAKGALPKLSAKGTNGYHCNTLYPWKLALYTGKDKSAQPTILRKDKAEKFAQEGVVFSIPAEIARVEVSFSMCDDKQCRMEKVELAWK